MDFTQITLKLLKLKKILIYILVAILLLILSLKIESTFNNYTFKNQIQYFSVDQKYAPRIEVSYSSDQNYEKYNSDNYKFPYFFKSTDSGIVKFYEDTFLSFRTDTIVRTINFQKKRLHLELIAGETIFDNRASKVPVTIQVKNIFLQPYTKGLYSVSQNEIVSLIGTSLVGIYDEHKLQKILVLPKGSKILIDNAKISKINTFKGYTDFYTKNKLLNSLDNYLNSQELFKLTFKGQLIDPLDDPLHATLLNPVIFNPTKKEFKELYGFVENLRAAELSLNTGNDSLAEIHLSKAKEYYLSSIVKDPSSINRYTSHFSSTINSLVGVHLTEEIFPIKLFLVTLLKDNSNKVFLSLLEDLDQSYAVIDPKNIEEILNFLILHANDPNIKKISSKLIEVIDDIAFRYDIAYNIKHFELRQKLSSNLTKTTDKVLFKTNTNLHLSRLKNLAESEAIPSGEAKQLLEFLLKSVGEDVQLEYQEFLLRLDS